MNSSQGQAVSSPAPAASGTIERDVSSRLVGGDSPIDFIKNNLAATQGAQAQTPVTLPEQANPVPVAPITEAAVTSPATAAVTVPEIDLPIDPQTPATEPDDVSAEEETTQAAPTKEESIKNLRRTAKQATSKLEETNRLLEEAQDRLRRFEAGEELSTKAQEIERENARLKTYEELHGFRTSKEYNQKYVTPLQTLKTQAEQLAKDYEVEPEVLNQALEIENKRDLNAFLKNHFDEVGALEVRDVLLKIKNLDAERLSLEEKPKESLQRLQEEFQREESLRVQERVTRISQTSRNSWVDALLENRSKGEFPELEIRQGDEKHNQIAKPILDEAAKEYGKFVKLLAALGVSELPAPVAKMLAQRFQLSQASSYVAASRAQHHAHTQSVIRDSRMMNMIARPQVGSFSDRSSEPPAPPADPKSAADQLLKQVRGGR